MNEYLNRRSNECVEMHLSQIVNNGSFEKRINIDDWTNRNNPMYKKLNNNHNYHWNYKYNHNDIKFLQINVNNRNSNNNNGNKNNKNNGQSFDINIQPMVLIKLNWFKWFKYIQHYYLPFAFVSSIVLHSFVI